MKEVRTQADLITPIASTIAIQDEHDRPFLDLLATNPQPLFFVTGMQTSRQVSTMESRSFPQQRLSDYSATRDHWPLDGRRHAAISQRMSPVTLPGERVREARCKIKN